MLIHVKTQSNERTKLVLPTFLCCVEFEIGMETGWNTEQVEGRGTGLIQKPVYHGYAYMDRIFNTDSTRMSRMTRSFWVGKTGLCFVSIQFN